MFAARAPLVPVLLGLLLTGCSNSKLIISPLYNRLDDQIRGEFHKLADFDENQIASFEDTLGTFHVWHRQYELPKYAKLLQSIGETVVLPEAIDSDTMQDWFDQTEGFTRSLRECHPINFSFPLMKSLTDEQLDFIQKRFQSEQGKNRKKYGERKPEERTERRKKRVVEFAARIGFEFTESQEKLLLETFEKQISLRSDYWLLSGKWNRQLFRMAKQQESPKYDERMEAHLQALWSLLENARPQQWQHNRDLWRDFGVKLVNSMNKEQRKWARAWLRKMGDTLTKISEDIPSATPSNDPAVGCYADAVADGGGATGTL